MISARVHTFGWAWLLALYGCADGGGGGAAVQSSPCEADSDRDAIADCIDGMRDPRPPRTFQSQASLPSLVFDDGATSGLMFDGMIDRRSVAFIEAAANAFEVGRDRPLIDSVVMHNLETSFVDGVSIFADGLVGTSTHYVIDFNGSIVQMVKDGDRAFHATYYNHRSIGIEMAGCGAAEPCTFPYPMQVAASNLVALLLRRHPIRFPPLASDTATAAGGTLDCNSRVALKFKGASEPGVIRHSQIQPRLDPNVVLEDRCNVFDDRGIGKVVLSQTTKTDPEAAFEWSKFEARLESRRLSIDSRPIVRVTELANPLGVALQASGGTTYAEVVPTCDVLVPTPSNPILFNGLVLRLNDGDRTEVSCGPLAVRVVSGVVEIDMDEALQLTVRDGGAAVLSEDPVGTLRVENRSAGQSISVVQRGLAKLLAPGARVELRPFEICSGGVDEDQDGLVDAADPQCKVCGNGRVEVKEECDDGNVVSGDGCSVICAREARRP